MLQSPPARRADPDFLLGEFRFLEFWDLRFRVFGLNKGFGV